MTPLLLLVLLSLPADSVIDAVFARQAELGRRIIDLSYNGEYLCTETDNLSGGRRELSCTRRVYMKGYGRQRHEIGSVFADGEELHGRDLAVAVRDLKSRGLVAGNTRMPFQREARTEYRYDVVDSDTWQGRPVSVVDFRPVRASKRHVRGRAFILKESSDVVRVTFSPLGLPFVVRHALIDMEYGRVGDYWLPTHFWMEIDLRLKMLVTVLDRRIEIDDDYSDYRFNQGLSDEFFDEQVVLPP